MGVRFGRRTYDVPAWRTDRTYVWTLEGSDCVFLIAVAVLLVFRGSFTNTQFMVALATIPSLVRRSGPPSIAF